ncbi:hypothetical protein CLV58_13110 [Spirosoma oryzae]|uniref:Uncharacterized protein n=1 Tax=Spirosoma oryzae TaxID=1469603 RepID=A0A2T0S313_9BACT|nr:hypothetical protein [Spirosoma oryzae]PRY27792.1 hypothetical protein CLV58_13110 [Spirosoma oryzae]
MMQVIQQVVNYTLNLSVDVFNEMGATGVDDLIEQAIQRMQQEQRMLASQPTAWLGYNAFNYALTRSKSSLSISERYQLDETMFHQFAALAYQ